MPLKPQHTKLLKRLLGLHIGGTEPTYYELLGISPDEVTDDSLDQAVKKRIQHIRSQIPGQQYMPMLTIFERALREAADTLRDPRQRRKYDHALKRQAAGKQYRQARIQAKQRNKQARRIIAQTMGFTQFIPPENRQILQHKLVELGFSPLNVKGFLSRIPSSLEGAILFAGDKQQYLTNAAQMLGKGKPLAPEDRRKIRRLAKQIELDESDADAAADAYDARHTDTRKTPPADDTPTTLDDLGDLEYGQVVDLADQPARVSPGAGRPFPAWIFVALILAVFLFAVSIVVTIRQCRLEQALQTQPQDEAAPQDQTTADSKAQQPATTEPPPAGPDDTTGQSRSSQPQPSTPDESRPQRAAATSLADKLLNAADDLTRLQLLNDAKPNRNITTIIDLQQALTDNETIAGTALRTLYMYLGLYPDAADIRQALSASGNRVPQGYELTILARAVRYRLAGGVTPCGPILYAGPPSPAVEQAVYAYRSFTATTSASADAALARTAVAMRLAAELAAQINSQSSDSDLWFAATDPYRVVQTLTDVTRTDAPPQEILRQWDAALARRQPHYTPLDDKEIERLSATLATAPYDSFNPAVTRVLAAGNTQAVDCISRTLKSLDIDRYDADAPIPPNTLRTIYLLRALARCDSIEALQTLRQYLTSDNELVAHEAAILLSRMRNVAPIARQDNEPSFILPLRNHASQQRNAATVFDTIIQEAQILDWHNPLRFDRADVFHRGDMAPLLEQLQNSITTPDLNARTDNSASNVGAVAEQVQSDIAMNDTTADGAPTPPTDNNALYSSVVHDLERMAEHARRTRKSLLPATDDIPPTGVPWPWDVLTRVNALTAIDNDTDAATDIQAGPTPTTAIWAVPRSSQQQLTLAMIRQAADELAGACRAYPHCTDRQLAAIETALQHADTGVQLTAGQFQAIAYRLKSLALIAATHAQLRRPEMGRPVERRLEQMEYENDNAADVFGQIDAYNRLLVDAYAMANGVSP